MKVAVLPVADALRRLSEGIQVASAAALPVAYDSAQAALLEQAPRDGPHVAAEQRDAADEGRLEASGSIIVGNEVIVNERAVVRPSQLIASVRPTVGGHRGLDTAAVPR
jgi:hypothetical protein